MVFLMFLIYSVLFAAQTPDVMQIRKGPIIGAKLSGVIPRIFHLLLWPAAAANFPMPCMAEVPGSFRR